MLLHAFLLSRQMFENKESDEGWWVFFSCLVSSNCSSKKAQERQHIGGKVHKIPFSNTPEIWCEDMVAQKSKSRLVAFFISHQH